MAYKYEVVVGNVGDVYHGDNLDEAMGVYDDYVRASKEGIEVTPSGYIDCLGRVGGEAVTLFADGEIEENFCGVMPCYAESSPSETIILRVQSVYVLRGPLGLNPELVKEMVEKSGRAPDKVVATMHHPSDNE